MALQKKSLKKHIQKHDLSVIIPTFREENKISRCIEESLMFLRNCKEIRHFEIIFVADNSGDGTIGIIKKYARKNKELKLIVNPSREMKGGSVKIGMLKAKYDTIMFYDADLSTPLYEIIKFLKFIDRYDIVTASRGIKGSKVEKKFFKIVLSRGFSFLKLVVLGITLNDTQCGFKMFKRKCLVLFEKQTIKTSTFDVEILFLAKKMNFRIHELPVTWIDSDVSNFNTFNVIFQMLRDVFKIRFNRYYID